MRPAKRIIIAAAAALLIAALLFAIHFGKKQEDSPLYELVSPYQKGLSGWDEAAQAPFEQGSAEHALLQGIELFDKGDYAGAAAVFDSAGELAQSDPALPAYLVYYSNECIYRTVGAGDEELVKEGLELAGEYAPQANDGKLVWGMVQTIAFAEEGGAGAVEMLEEYLEEHEELETEIWATLKNALGMLLYLEQSYAMSICNFYDVQIRLEGMEQLTPELQRSLDYAQLFIANLYQLFGEYRTAIVLYQNAAESADIADRYSHYLNISAACINMGELEGAREFALMAAESLPHMDEALAPDVRAHIAGTLANISMLEGKWEEALGYIEEAEEIYSRDVATVFHGGPQMIETYRCRYMLHEGDAEGAARILEEQIRTGEAAQYGMEPEVYRLLLDCCTALGQDEQLPGLYRRLLEHDTGFQQTIQREYIEFSMYYRDSMRLAAENTRLARQKNTAIMVAMVTAIVLLLALLLARGLHMKAVMDPLTGIFNRKKLNAMMLKCMRRGTPGKFGVIMLDIDFFKRYNDTLGHPAGDAVIKSIAELLMGCVRGKDLVIRYGGEEFLLLIYDVSEKTACEVCERIRRQMAKAAIPHPASDVAEHVTVSMGLCYQEQSSAAQLTELIRQADECLYRSKQEGRNRYTAMTRPGQWS